jgi:hypothetical protein
MGVDRAGAPKANGLKTALDTIISPKEAFEQLRVAPTWGWALLLTIVLYAVASYLLTPAIVHGMQADWPRQIAENPRLAALSPSEQQNALKFSLAIIRWAWIVAPIVAPLAMLVHTIVMYVFKAIGKGDAPFRALWSTAANIALPVLGVNALVTAIIAMVRGADSFNSPAEVQTALPSLGLLVPATAVKLHAFLAAFNPFTLWGCGLTIGAMIVVAAVPRVWAWTTGIVWLLISAGLVALSAR